jgi:hypothetical protein
LLIFPCSLRLRQTGKRPLVIGESVALGQLLWVASEEMQRFEWVLAGVWVATCTAVLALAFSGPRWPMRRPLYPQASLLTD